MNPLSYPLSFYKNWVGAPDEKKRADEKKRPSRPQPGEILDFAPERIERPLMLVGGRAYAASWPHISTKDGDRQALVIVRDDGALFSDDVLGTAALSELGISVHLPENLFPDACWGGAAIKRYADGDRPDPAEVFAHLAAVSDHFLDFNRSLGDQRTMSELIACYTMGTYFLDGTDVVGYLWANGSRGSGKSKLLRVVASCAFLGQVVLSGGSLAGMRDTAHYGATLCLDDIENLKDKSFDPDKRQLLLAGNCRGTWILLKEPNAANNRKWDTRRINGYAPRLFSAISMPDSTLGSRSLLVSMVASTDQAKSNRSPQDPDSWPVDRLRLRDDLWAVGLSALPSIRQFDREAATRSTLVGRNLEPWRLIFITALFLERAGVAGLFDRMLALSKKYQDERRDLEAADRTRILIRSLRQILDEGQAGGQGPIVVATKAVADCANQIAEAEEVLPDDGKPFMTPSRVGKELQRLRVEKAPRSSGAKRWRILPKDVEGLEAAYLPLGSATSAASAASAAASGTPTTLFSGPDEGQMGGQDVPALPAHPALVALPALAPAQGNGNGDEKIGSATAAGQAPAYAETETGAPPDPTDGQDLGEWEVI